MGNDQPVGEKTHMFRQTHVKSPPRLHGWWFQPLWKIWKLVGVTISNIWRKKRCSKPPTSYMDHWTVDLLIDWLTLSVVPSCGKLAPTTAKASTAAMTWNRSTEFNGQFRNRLIGVPTIYKAYDIQAYFSGLLGSWNSQWWFIIILPIKSIKWSFN